jgi:hypothetical protein
MPRGRPRKNAAGEAAAAHVATRGRANNRPQVPFAYKLVLNQWLLLLFNDMQKRDREYFIAVLPPIPVR